MGEVEEIQRQIAELDKQINKILTERRLPPLKPPKPFPLGTWILAALAGGYYLFGDLIPVVGQFYATYQRYALYATLALGAYALVRTALWLFSRKPKTPPEYLEASQQVQELQNQRRLLEKELREARKRAAGG
ncbi:MAG: hypothetical protein N2Z21_08065 [Candidatus Sumerlaeaceae bacterium]|nr:hypothetical protein [Candidatus Sumerlaeaceae bacterium]